MGIANTLTNNVTNLNAMPPVALDKRLFNGILKEQVGTVEIAAADDNGSVYRLGRVHSSWRISEMTLFNDAITSGAVFDVGLYRTAADGGAVVDANAFADNISLTSASLTGVALMYEGGSVVGVEDVEQMVYQVAGETTDPGYWYDVCLTGDTVGSGSGTVTLRIRYVTGD